MSIERIAIIAILALGFAGSAGLAMLGVGDPANDTIAVRTGADPADGILMQNFASDVTQLLGM